MASNPESQEFHENIREYFPDFDSVRTYKLNFNKKNKSALMAKALGIIATVGTVTMVLIPYIICRPLSIGENAASFSVKAMNAKPDTEISYLITENPNTGTKEQELLKTVIQNSGCGELCPDNGILRLQGLKARTPYRLVFFTEGDSATGEKPEVLGCYNFRSGTVPKSNFIKWLERILNKQAPPEPPELPAAVEDTEESDESQEPVISDRTSKPKTEESSTQEPEKPVRREEPGREEPSSEEPDCEEPGSEEPGSEEPGCEEPGCEEPGREEPGSEEPGREEPGREEPETEEPGTGEPGTGEPDTGEPDTGTQDDPVFTDSPPVFETLTNADSILSFSASFPFASDVPLPDDLAAKYRSEVKVVKTDAEGIDSETAADSKNISIEKSGTDKNVLNVKVAGLHVNLGERISIEPSLFYKREDQTEVPVKESSFVLKPAGVDNGTKVDFTYEKSKKAEKLIEYTLALTDIVNSQPAEPSNSSLYLKELVFTFLDEAGNQIGETRTEAVNELIEGTEWNRTGDVVGDLTSVKSVKVSVHAVWKIDDSEALPTSIDATVKSGP